MNYQGEDHLKKSKIIDYRSDDPRYGFTIKNSNEFNETIYPFHIKKTCDCDFMKKLEETYPPITRCWAERYENCIDIMALHDQGCETCKINLYDNTKSTIGWDIDSTFLDGFNPKKQDDNNFYDQTRISTVLNPELKIDRSPDITQFNENKKIEHYDDDEDDKNKNGDNKKFFIMTNKEKAVVFFIILAIIVFIILTR